MLVVMALGVVLDHMHAGEYSAWLDPMGVPIYVLFADWVVSK